MTELTRSHVLRTLALLGVVAACASIITLRFSGDGEGPAVDDVLARLERLELELRSDERHGDALAADVPAVGESGSTRREAGGNVAASEEAQGASADAAPERAASGPEGPIYGASQGLPSLLPPAELTASELMAYKAPYSLEDHMDPARVAEMRTIYLDPLRGDEERIQALEHLRAAALNGFPREEALTDEIVGDAIHLISRLDDPRQRRQGLAALSEVASPDLKREYVEYALHDPDRRVRERAIQNLALYRNDEEIAELLEQVAAGDPEEEVRQRAEEALGKRTP